MKNKIFTISLISLIALGLIIPNVNLGQLKNQKNPKNQTLVVETEPIQGSSLELLQQFLIRQLQEENQDIDPSLLDPLVNSLQAERGPDGTIYFKPSESKTFLSNPSLSGDVEAPQLLEFDFTPKTIDTSYAPQTVTFTLRITDNSSGLSLAFWNLYSPSGQQRRPGWVDQWDRISGDALDGVYQTSVEFPQYSEEGVWRVGHMGMDDGAGNSGDFNEQDLINLGFPTKIEVISVPEDITPPQIQEFGFSPTHIDTSESSQTVTLTFRITDDLSGFEVAFWYIYSPSGQQMRSGWVDQWDRISGDALDGVYQTSVEFPQYSEEGTWYVYRIFLSDKVSNTRKLYEQDLIDLGFPTKLVNVEEEVPLEIKVVQLDVLKDIDIRDVEDPIWTIENPSVYDPIADAMQDRYAYVFTYSGSFKVKIDIEAFPIKPSWKPICNYTWLIPGTDKRGFSTLGLKDTDTGWSGEFEIHTPQKVGKYSLILDFTIYDDKDNAINSQRMEHPLYVTYEEPKLPKPEEKPKEIWLDKATEWASGATNKEEVAFKINQGIYDRSMWKYRDKTPNWWELVEGIKSEANCWRFAEAWVNLTQTLGVNAVLAEPYTGIQGEYTKGFVTKTDSIALKPESLGGNAHLLAQPVDRWRFSMHQLGKLGILSWRNFYDPTFGKKYDAKDEFIEWDQITYWYWVDSELWADLTEGHRIHLLDESNNRGWGDYEYHSGAKFTGNYNTYGVDTDEDGIYNHLAVDVEINVTRAGDYLVSGRLESNETVISDRKSMYSTIPSAYPLTVQEPGLKTLTLNFSGADIYDSGIDGIHTASLYIRDENGLIIDKKSFDTPVYNHTQFGEVLRTKVDKLPESSENILSVNIRTLLNIIWGIIILIIILGIVLGYKYWRKRKKKKKKFKIPWLIILFVVFSLAIGGFAYQKTDLVNSSNPAPVSNTNSGAEFTGNYTAYGIDSDGDGIYNHLAVDVEINVTELGEYIIGGGVNSNGEVIATRESIMNAMPVAYSLIAQELGPQTAILKFSGGEIYIGGKDGIYTVELFLSDEEGLVIDTRAFDTPVYSYIEFGKIPARIEAITDYTEDVDNDGLFNYLTIETSINVRSPMDYSLDGMLYSNEGDELIYQANYAYLENTGTIKLNFDGAKIRKSEKGGPYILAITLYDKNGSQIDYEEYNTSIYSYTDFQEPASKFTGVYSDYGRDTDGDGLFDYLTIEAEANIGIPGDYEITGWLYDKNGKDIDVEITSVVHLDNGIQSVALSFDGIIIYQSQVDGPYYLRHFSLGSNEEIIDFMEDVYTTSIYKFTDFQKPYIVEFISASVKIEPEILNLASKGVFTALVQLPEEYDVADIDVDTVECEGAEAIRGNIRGNDTLIVKFRREDLVDVLTGNEVEITVAGELMDGTKFEGSDIIRIINKGRKR